MPNVINVKGGRRPMSGTTAEKRDAPASGRQCDGNSNAPRLKLLITSEVRFLRESLGEVLGRDGAVTVIGCCADLGQTLSMSRERRPDMVLIDAALRDGVL